MTDPTFSKKSFLFILWSGQIRSSSKKPEATSIAIYIYKKNKYHSRSYKVPRDINPGSLSIDVVKDEIQATTNAHIFFGYKRIIHLDKPLNLLDISNVALNALAMKKSMRIHST